VIISFDRRYPSVLGNRILHSPHSRNLELLAEDLKHSAQRKLDAFLDRHLIRRGIDYLIHSTVRSMLPHWSFAHFRWVLPYMHLQTEIKTRLKVSAFWNPLLPVGHSDNYSLREHKAASQSSIHLNSNKQFSKG
jgi:hypothetical protein